MHLHQAVSAIGMTISVLSRLNLTGTRDKSLSFCVSVLAMAQESFLSAARKSRADFLIVHADLAVLPRVTPDEV